VAATKRGGGGQGIRVACWCGEGVGRATLPGGHCHEGGSGVGEAHIPEHLASVLEAADHGFRCSSLGTPVLMRRWGFEAGRGSRGEAEWWPAERSGRFRAVVEG
jgi:hypothetical protein